MCVRTRPPRLLGYTALLGPKALSHLLTQHLQVTWGPSSLPRAQAQAGVNSAGDPVGLPRQVA